VKLTKSVKVGFLATLALIIIYLGTNFLKGRTLFASSNTYHTIYEHCKGLNVASPVLLNGVSVGTVRKLQVLPHKGYSVLVTFDTKKDVKLTDATQARLASTSILGYKAIDLHLGEGKPLKNYDTVPGHVEQSMWGTIFESTMPALGDVQNISALTSQFIANLIANTDKINSIFSNLEDTTYRFKKTLHDNQHNFHIVSQNMSEVSSALAHGKDGVGPLLKNINQLMQGVEGVAWQELAMKFDSILSSVSKILNKMAQDHNSVSQLLDNDEFYTNLNQTLGDLDALLVDFKTRPWRYINFSVFGKKQSQQPTQRE